MGLPLVGGLFLLGRAGVSFALRRSLARRVLTKQRLAGSVLGESIGGSDMGLISFLGGLLAGPAVPPSVMAAEPAAIIEARTASAVGRITAAGAAAQPAVGRAGFVTLADGSRVLMTSGGNLARPQFFLTAGAQIPGGGTIVSVSPDGLLFGIRRKARRRTFRTEMNRCKNVIRSADKLLSTLRKGKR